MLLPTASLQHEPSRCCNLSCYPWYFLAEMHEAREMDKPHFTCSLKKKVSESQCRTASSHLCHHALIHICNYGFQWEGRTTWQKEDGQKAVPALILGSDCCLIRDWQGGSLGLNLGHASGLNSTEEITISPSNSYPLPASSKCALLLAALLSWELSVCWP